MMFGGTFGLLANIHIVIPQLKLREWSIEFCVILPSVLVLWLTIYMQCNGYYTLKKEELLDHQSSKTPARKENDGK